MMEFFKANEKVIMVVLLAIIAPSFAATGLMFNALQSVQDPVILEIDGESFTQTEVASARRHLGRVLGAPSGVPRRATMDGVIEHKLILNEAKRLGLAVPREQLKDAIVEVGRQLIAIHLIMEENPNAPFETISSLLSTRLESTLFRRDDYRKALMNKNLGWQLSVAQFESALEEALLRGQVLEVCANAYPVSESEIYDEYKRQTHKRSFDVVRVKSEDMFEIAKTKAAEESGRLLETFNANKAKYASKGSVKLEIAQVTPSTRINYEPTEEEMQALYEKDKDKFFRKPKPAPAPGAESRPADAPAEAETVEYIPYEEAKQKVKGRVQIAKARDSLKAALAEGQARKVKNEEFELIDLFGDYALAVEIYETGYFTLDDVSKLPEEYRNEAELNRLLAGISVVSVGDLSQKTVKLDKGDYIYRVVDKKGGQVPESIEECRDKVIDDLAEVMCSELATETLDLWTKRIRDEGATFKALAEEASYKIHSIEALGRFEGSKMRIDNVAVPGSHMILRDVFELDAPGDVTETIASFDGKEVYIATLTGLAEPDSGDYEIRRPGLEAQLERERQTFAMQEYLRGLREKASIKIRQWDEQPEPSDVQ